MKIPSATTAAIITLLAFAVAAVTTSIAGPSRAAAAQAEQDGSVSHGRYLVTITGCHDCHTQGHAQSGGHAPPANWLTGSPVGFQDRYIRSLGPAGTPAPAAVPPGGKANTPSIVFEPRR